MQIRPETPHDWKHIATITKHAFEGKAYASGTEFSLPDRLREAEALSLSLVAELNGQVVGHIALSKVLIDQKDQNCFGLGPVAVTPEHQGKGIDAALIEQALNYLKENESASCVLVGDPGYYSRFGFLPENQMIYSHVAAPYFQSIRFGEHLLKGDVTFHPAFDD